MLSTSSAVHPAILQRFQALLQKGRLGHAYLFLGPRYVGKTETAFAVAKLLNCDENLSGERKEPCDRCPSCRKIDSGNHPDVKVIDSGEEETIKILAVRDLLS